MRNYKTCDQAIFFCIFFPAKKKKKKKIAWSQVTLLSVACVAWRFCRSGRRSGVAAKFAREARENERRSREKKLLPPQSPRGLSALARLYYLARPTKTAMLRRLYYQ